MPKILSVFCFICMNLGYLSLHVLTTYFLTLKQAEWTAPAASNSTDASVVTVPWYCCASLFW